MLINPLFSLAGERSRGYLEAQPYASIAFAGAVFGLALLFFKWTARLAEVVSYLIAGCSALVSRQHDGPK
jgi:hypothetical protein